VSKVINVHALERLIGPKWSVETIDALAHGPRRWTELVQRLTAASGEVVHNKSLNSALRHLQERRIVDHTSDHHGPVYRLTHHGHDLNRLLDQMHGWAERHRDTLDL